jgi:hypothetical protein
MVACASIPQTSMRWYGRAAWQRARKQALFDANWTCTRCGCSLVGLGQEAQVHHRKALKVAPSLGLEPLNLQPLCRRCHTEIEKGGGLGACTIDGTPTDPRHPWAKARQYQGKNVRSVRDARKGDQSFQEGQDQVVVTMDDGTEKTVKRSEVTGQAGEGQHE